MLDVSSVHGQIESLWLWVYKGERSHVKEAAWAGVPLQDDVVSLSFGEEVTHLKTRGSSSKHTVVMVMGTVVTVVVIGEAMDQGDQEGKPERKERRIHHL